MLMHREREQNDEMEMVTFLTLFRESSFRDSPAVSRKAATASSLSKTISNTKIAELHMRLYKENETNCSMRNRYTVMQKTKIFPPY